VLAERPGFREYADYKWSAQSPVMWATMVQETSTSPTSWGELASIAVPVLVIVGDEDTTFLPAGEAIADTVPGAELVVIP